MRSDAEYRYWCRLFVTVRYESCFFKKYGFQIMEMAVIWRRAGVCHRLDGPAVVIDEDTQVWYRNGIKYLCSTGEEWEEADLMSMIVLRRFRKRD